MARKVPEVPSASLADIAFMLLIFFLVTTTMETEVINMVRSLSSSSSLTIGLWAFRLAFQSIKSASSTGEPTS